MLCDLAVMAADGGSCVSDLAALAAEGRIVHIVSGYATHTANTVFWIATRKLVPTVAGYQAGEGSSVYAARL